MSASRRQIQRYLLAVVLTLSLVGIGANRLSAGNESNDTYLALGDSIAYGLNILLLPPPPFTQTPLPTPSQFTGYPEVIANRLHLVNSGKEMNTSCPGESSGSFYIAGAPDYGCHDNGPQGQPPFKTWIGLHTNYPGTQLDFAVSQLQSNKHIDLVTLGIGANDMLLLLAKCGSDETCVAEGLPGALLQYGQNLGNILNAIRLQAGYKGRLVILLQYSPQTALTPIAAALNVVTISVASGYGVTFADGFTAFQLASLPYGGDPCKAGLLVNLGAAGCDIHPSPKGHDILASTILAAIGGNL
jgi:lysophospholipase L1-like esterase